MRHCLVRRSRKNCAVKSGMATENAHANPRAVAAFCCWAPFQHSGSGRRTGLLFLDVDVTQRDHNNPLFNAVMTRSRESRFGVMRAQGTYASCCVNSNAIMWCGTTRDFGRKTVFSPRFWVSPAATITAISRIARASGAAVVTIGFVPV